VRVAAIGCFMAGIGFVSMAMFAVLIARLYSWVSGCQYVAELPACNWEKFAAVGGVIGAVTLPTLVIRRLRQHEGTTRGAN
jgi:hypothetical protein